MDLEELGIRAGNWVDSAKDRDCWRALVNVALKTVSFNKMIYIRVVDSCKINPNDSSLSDAWFLICIALWIRV